MMHVMPSVGTVQIAILNKPTNSIIQENLPELNPVKKKTFPWHTDQPYHSCNRASVISIPSYQPHALNVSAQVTTLSNTYFFAQHIERTSVPRWCDWGLTL